MELHRSLSDLRCVKNKTCGLEVTIPSCSNLNREKRSSTLDVSMQLTSEITDDSDLRLDDLFNNNIGKAYYRKNYEKYLFSFKI